MKKLTANLVARRSVATLFGHNPRGSRPHFGLLSSMSVTAVGLLLAQPAMADIACPAPSSSSSTTTTCTVDSDQSGNLTVDFTAGAASGSNSGVAQPIRTCN